MTRWHATIVFFALAGGTGCQHIKHAGYSIFDDYVSITFKVDGLMKTKSGAT